MKKRLVVLIGIWLFAAAFAGAANAALVGDDLSARVKGTTHGNWEIGLGDQVGVPGGFVQATGDDLWMGSVTYNFTLNYDSTTGVADFQVQGAGFTSTLLQTPDYGLQGFGFTGISLGLREDSANSTELIVCALRLNGVWLSGIYSATDTYTEYALYSGPLLTDISLTGEFTVIGDYQGNNERTKFDVNLTGVSPVPAPTAIILLGSGLLGLAGAGRRKKS